MPPKSEAQRRFMYAAAEGKVPGVSPKVGREFVAADPGGALPERVKPKRIVDKKQFMKPRPTVKRAKVRRKRR